MARTLNSQLVYEYILHCLRSTYKYFALPHKQNAKNNQIKSLEGSILLEPEKNDFKQTIPDIKNVHNEMENTVIDSCITSTKKSSYFPQEHMCEPSQVFIDENFVEEQLADGEHLGMSYEDSDCIIEEFILGDNEEFKPSCEETESGNEDEEEGHEQEHLASNQDSESGDLAIPISEHDVETDSISDLEIFQNVVAALDEFALEERGIPNDKLDIDEESTEGTDELDDSLFKLEPPTQEQISEMDNSEEEDEEEEAEEEDEEHSIKSQGQHENIVNTEDELDNTYTGSGVEEPLSEEEELLIAHGDIELKKRVDEFSSVDLNKEDDPEKEVLIENNKPVDQNYRITEYFYEFNKTAFTKGKVIAPIYQSITNHIML